jgi:hypothetical protein
MCEVSPETPFVLFNTSLHTRQSNARLVPSRTGIVFPNSGKEKQTQLHNYSARIRRAEIKVKSNTINITKAVIDAAGHTNLERFDSVSQLPLPLGGIPPPPTSDLRYATSSCSTFPATSMTEIPAAIPVTKLLVTIPIRYRMVA